jgi:tRNA G18 (ribose-2'-O)-methylase SpoU
MAVIHLDHSDDPRLEPFRGMTDRQLMRSAGLFVAEGEYLLRRLVASGFPLHSVLVDERKREAIEPAVPDAVPLLVADRETIRQIVGYRFHRGVIACGRRRPLPTLEEMLVRLGERAVVMVCPEISDAENLGSLIRVAAAFGLDGLILGERCADPLYRRTIRVSMGHVFHLPLVQCDDLKADLLRMRDEAGFELAATVTDRDATPLEAADRPARLGLLFGAEGPGLHPRWRRLCDRAVTIPMPAGVDSLNVANAAAVVAYHFTRVAASRA